ncbi:DUF305 domain-containing protein [Loktanella sp. SALINAS62]|uniref:DUF305 domain-containing protein n=1 Tax=Loktanella sp. SALINAS62 TaxID=2706124 RepID=UPI001B8D3C06|nr:DUF305 domain-containing protein [Loktanella sp. SALINAS62]MBS1300973.1 DUF305 domain-containing protein [Loktanella sp. SALINAS62]
MIKMKPALAVVLAATGLAGPAFAQDAAFQLPAECTVATAMDGMDHAAMGHGGGDESSMGMDDMDHSAMGHGGSDNADMGMDAMPAHVQENMRRMMITMPAMEQGMMNEDADVAFACGMIAHHQGAIDMAQVLLEHGDNPEMIALAGEIIAAQVEEIDEMILWLAENGE